VSLWNFSDSCLLLQFINQILLNIVLIKQRNFCFRKESRPQAKVKLEEDTKSIAKWKSKQKSEQKVTPLMIDEIEPEKIDKNFDVWFIAKDFRPNGKSFFNYILSYYPICSNIQK